MTKKSKSPAKSANPKSTGAIQRKTAKSRNLRSEKSPEHGIFPDYPPIFAVDEADAETALGIEHRRG